MRLLALCTGLLGIAFLATTGRRSAPAVAGTRIAANAPDTLRWQLAGNGGIRWPVAQDARLPHNDHVEMSGRKVSVIVQYGVDADRRLVLSREVYWPTLRTAPQPGEPDWYKYRA
ncbi:MAG TPA: hypothetical protein VF646_13740, partial [Cytophagales bacterium]